MGIIKHTLHPNPPIPITVGYHHHRHQAIRMNVVEEKSPSHDAVTRKTNHPVLHFRTHKISKQIGISSFVLPHALNLYTLFDPPPPISPSTSPPIRSLHPRTVAETRNALLKQGKAEKQSKRTPCKKKHHLVFGVFARLGYGVYPASVLHTMTLGNNRVKRREEKSSFRVMSAIKSAFKISVVQSDQEIHHLH